MSGLSTRQHYSEIQDMILSVTKSEKIKYSWKRSSSVFNMMGITFHYTAIHQKQKTKTKNKTLVSSTSIYFQLNHCWTDWNGPSSMKWCSKNVQMHAGKPNSPFSAKILPFSAKTPVLGKISPFAVQSSRYPHAIFSIEINVAKEKYIVIKISGRFVKKFVLSGPLYII